MIDRHRKSFLTKERRSSKGCSAKNVMAQPLEGGSHQCACAQQTSRTFRMVLESGGWLQSRAARFRWRVAAQCGLIFLVQFVLKVEGGGGSDVLVLMVSTFRSLYI